MENYTPEELIRKYLAGTCTPEEKALVESWHLNELAADIHTPTHEQINVVHERMQVALTQHIQANRHRPVIKKMWFRMAAAALITGCIFTVAYLYYIKSSRNGTVAYVKQPAIRPGHDGAVLTLVDGSTIVLDSSANGLLAIQPGSKVVLNNGQLAYQSDNSNTTALSYNTISTPRGRQFKIALPDGSLVWLNAASSLRYPTVFTGSERKVYVTGEAYFEIKPLTRDGGEKKMPFKVILPAHREGTGGGEVEVLGTHFNINAYDDEEAIKTTLLEGSVKVRQTVPLGGSNKQSIDGAAQKPDETAKNNVFAVVLKPGEQAVLANNSRLTIDDSRLTIDHSPNLDEVIAWKNGEFNFQDATLEKVMRQLTRWYDIEVVYEKGIPDIVFEGEINRQNELADVLHSLEKLGVHFKLNGRRLTVLP
ncbi:MAG TPA: FecR domain-containing protein [Niastella sp.]